jgi:hypothetical protein
MKVAYLCLAHDNFEYVDWLAKHLTQDGDGFFLHVDKKSVFPEKVLGNSSHVTFLSDKERVRSQWGSFAIVKATIRLLKLALKDAREFDAFFLVSGHDYPLYSARSIKAKLRKGNDYISVWEVVSSESKDKEFFGRHYYEYDILNPGLSYKSGSRLRIYFSMIMNLIISNVPISDNFQFENYAKGSQWWCLSRDTCQSIIQEIERGLKVSEFELMHAPDEKFFQTLYFNLINPLVDKYSSRVLHALHYIDWEGRNGPKLHFELEHANIAREEGALFARKISQSSMQIVINSSGVE